LLFKVIRIAKFQNPENHGFVWRHLLVLNFWWMFYAAIKSHVTGKSYMIGSWELMSFIEIGATEPDKAVWMQVWRFQRGTYFRQAHFAISQKTGRGIIYFFLVAANVSTPANARFTPHCQECIVLHI
jgi:hypothetical protein